MTDEDSEADPEAEITMLRARAEMLETALRETRLARDERLVHAELRVEAARHGMIDFDELKLIDQGQVSIDEDGAVKDAAAVVRRLRRDKPWLFGAPSSSSHAGVPASAPIRKKTATEMSLDEWRAARADLLKRR
jgi:hypothetical protein